MSKQKIPIHLRKAIWIAYNCKSSYEGTPIEFLEMEIDHIIPERVLNNPKEPKELNKWKALMDEDTEEKLMTNLITKE